MEKETLYIWSWLNILTKKRYDALCTVYGGLDEALQHIDEDMLSKLGCRQETIYATLNRLEEFDLQSYVAEVTKRGLTLISIEDDAYPLQLEQIGDPPVFLYVRGDLSILDQPCIGLVGTRAMSAYGKRVAEDFAPAFVRAGMTTVSGLASGIDTVVARETLAAGGKTVAILGHGLATIFPKENAQLAEEIVESGGLIMSEYPLDVESLKMNFPARNRIVAGLSVATVVLEAPEGSGALITADLALDYGREVYAVPGQIYDENYAGSHRFIAEGRAKLAADASVIIADLGIVSPDPQAHSGFEPENERESAIYNALTTMPQSASNLVERINMPAADLNAGLTMLEIKGVARNVGSGQWVRCS